MSVNNNRSKKLNKVLIITGIVLIITVIITLFIILNKGKIFGFRLVAISEKIEETHTIGIVVPDSYLFVDGDGTELYVTIDGEDVTEGYEIVLSDEEIVSIEENVISPLGVGTVTITVVSSEYDIQSEITISVIEPITKLTIESEYTKIEIDEKAQISYEYEPTDASIDIEYVSTDEEIATVNEEGIVTGISEGSVTIIATDSITGKSASCSITVEN